MQKSNLIKKKLQTKRLNHFRVLCVF